MSGYISNGALTVNKARMQLQNQQTQRILNAFSGISGAMGTGDRGAGQTVPVSTGNPWEYASYIDRWRQYTHLYEISWEARKIVRIPVEDALRKDWIPEDIPEEMSEYAMNRLKKLNFNTILSRSMMMERLLGGSLTFCGLDSDEDDVEKEYHPREGSHLRFLNAIPISRISRAVWETNPLKENYMRPSHYMINGESLSISRCLVWDGEPLFDPYDFALTNWRANLAGFGPSKLAPIWEDIIRAVGTRQAAYHMIQVNNALIMIVKEFQSLAGTKAGNDQIKLLKEIANNLSAYRAAVIEKDKAELSQHSASFGSVPELLLTFIQILSAASDIPATRFIGQAPGGLNATGESDLENYYNVIDAMQRNRIEPCLRRMFDFINYEKFGKLWDKARDTLTFKFPPLWNASELEEAQTAKNRLDNVILARENGFISDEKCIAELNAKNVFTVDLEEEDLDLMSDMGVQPGQPDPMEPQGQEQPQDKKIFPVPEGITKQNIQPKDSQYQPANPKSPTNPTPPKVAPAKKAPGVAQQRRLNSVRVINKENFPEVPVAVAQRLLAELGETEIDPKELAKGMNIEFEHYDLTNGDLKETAQIAIAHLKERSDYYEKLKEYVENSEIQIKKIRTGLYKIIKNGIEYQVHYTPSNEYEKSKPWKLDEISGGRWISISRHKTSKEAIDQIKLFNTKENPTICIDFDGTIADESEGFQGQDVFGEPLQGASEEIQELKKDGWKIIIFTVREESPELVKYLEENQIPYDEINKNSDQPDETNEGKPIADLYLDNKGVRFVGWHNFAKNAKRYLNSVPWDSVNRHPTKAQKKAGNYKKGFALVHGLEISIENPKGSERSGEDKEGKSWSSILPADYGYIRRTEGADGDHVDVYLGPNDNAGEVYIVDQKNLKTGKFDEHKCILGIDGEAQARQLYLDAFSDDKGNDRIMNFHTLTVEEFKNWLKEGDTTIPFSNEATFEESDHPRSNDGKFTSGGGDNSNQKEKPKRKRQDTSEAKEEKFLKSIEHHSEYDKSKHIEARKIGITLPPAWKDVWINTGRRRDLLATGIDTKGRKQYVYSASHNNKKAAEKFNRVKKFTQAHPEIISKIEKDFDKKPEAQVLYLIDKTGFRIGSDNDTGAEKQAYGASTLLNEHIEIDGKIIRFNFMGKKGVKQSHEIEDERLAKIISSKKEGRIFDTNDSKVRGYLKSITGGKFKVKDFRTYVATSTSLSLIQGMKQPKTEKEKNKAIMEIAKKVSQKLGNTPHMARDSYIDPTVFKAWEVTNG